MKDAAHRYGDADVWWRRTERLASPFFAIKHWQWITFFVLTALALRLALVLTHEPHLGIDIGAYVLSALDVQGKEHTTVGFPRPPLAPGWLLVPFIEIWGIDIGSKIWTAVFSLLPILPVYLLARDLANKSAAAFAVAFMSVDLMQMEMMVTGSLPLIGFTLIGLSVWSIFHLSKGFTKLHWLTIVGSVGLLPYINQTSAGIAGIILPLITISVVFFGRKETNVKKTLFYVISAALIGVLLGIGSLPWYLANMPGNSELRYPGPLFIFIRWQDPALMLQAPIVVTLIYLIWRHTDDYRLRASSVAIGVMGVMIMFLSYDEAVVNILFRPRYLLSILVYPAIAYLICRNWPLLPSFKEEWVTIVPMVAMWGVLLWTQTFIFQTQAFYKDMIYPEAADALGIAKVEHPGKAIITNAYSMSHWVAAINQVESPNTWGLEPSPYYTESDKHVRCLLGWVDGCDAQTSAQQLNASYILIDERIPKLIRAAPTYGRVSDDEWKGMLSVPWLRLRHADGMVKLWEIRF